MKGKTKLTLISALALIVIVVITAVVGILVFSDVIKWDSSPYLIMFALLSLGVGAYTLGYSAYAKSGYALGVGSIVFDAGVICLLISLHVLTGIIVAVGIAIFLICLILLVLMQYDAVKEGYKTTDSKQDYVPYMEKLKQEKEEALKTQQELPEIKSFKED